MKYLPIIIIGLLIYLIGMNIVMVNYLKDLKCNTELQALVIEKESQIMRLEWKLSEYDILFGDMLE